MQIGALLEDLTVAKARAGIERLVHLTPQTARVLRNGNEFVISSNEVQVGDLLRVLPGETIPVDGTITAGQPITAIEEIEGYIPLSDFTGDAKDLFALNVRGDSMIEAGILDGDIVILRQTPVARNGQIVAAMLDGEATLKRFYKENGHFRLQPENSSMDPFIVDEVVILGTLVALYRRYE